MFGACISSGMGILEACRVTGTSMGFSEQVVRRSMLISFGILTSATDDRLERELESG